MFTSFPKITDFLPYCKNCSFKPRFLVIKFPKLLSIISHQVVSSGTSTTIKSFDLVLIVNYFGCTQRRNKFDKLYVLRRKDFIEDKI